MNEIKSLFTVTVHLTSLYKDCTAFSSLPLIPNDKRLNYSQSVSLRKHAYSNI